jgi:arsenite methyltransferase
VIRALDIQQGQYIADIGAGSVYFTFRFAEANGLSGKVYAVDVNSGMIDYIKLRSVEDGYLNVETILAEPQDPLLPEGGVDLMFLCNTYHHIEDREKYFKHAARYLSDKGRVAIIDLVGEGWIEKISGHWIAKDVIRGEMEAAGYRLQQEYGILPRQSFLIFTLADQ